MQRLPSLPLILALTLAPASAWVGAQPTSTGDSNSQTRSEVKMDRDEFLRTHVWDSTSDVWSLKSGMAPPTGVMSRAEVKAERDTYLRNNRYDTVNGWVPLKKAPRNMGTMSRAEVKAQTLAFDRTHRFDEVSGTWVMR